MTTTPIDALHLQTAALLDSGRHDEAVAACDDFLGQGVSNDDELAVQLVVATALLAKGRGCAAAGEHLAAFAAFDDLVHRVGDASDEELKRCVADALIAKAEGLTTLDARDSALTVLDDQLLRAAGSADLELLRTSAVAAQMRAANLWALKRGDEAVVAYEELAARFRESEDEWLAGVAVAAVVDSAQRLQELGDNSAALARCESVLAEPSAVPLGDRIISRALRAKGLALGGLGRFADAANAFAALGERCAASADAVGHVEAGRWCAWAFGQTGDVDAAVAAYDRVIEERNAMPDPAVQRAVARAMLDKAELLSREGQSGAAAAAFDELAVAFGAAEDPDISALVARGLNGKGTGALMTGDLDAAIVSFDSVVARLAGTEEAVGTVGRQAMLNLGQALMLAERFEEAAHVFERYVDAFSDDVGPVAREHVALALNNLSALLKEVLGRPEDGHVAYQRLLRDYPDEALQAAEAAALQAAGSLEPGDRARRAQAMFSTATLLRDLGRTDHARSTADAIGIEYEGDKDPVVSEIRESALRLREALD